MKVKVLKTVSSFGEVIVAGSIFEGNKESFPKIVLIELEHDTDCVIVLEDDVDSYNEKLEKEKLEKEQLEKEKLEKEKLSETKKKKIGTRKKRG